MRFTYPEGSTPFSQDDIHNLIPKHITTQSQLDEWEQFNIIDAEKWAFSRARTNLLSIEFTQLLHKKMFNKTWKWAGMFRSYQTNIGVEAYKISIDLKMLCDDVIYQIQNKIFSDDEIAVRFHHRLVFIHPFPNGNGRHARLMTDLLLTKVNKERFTWGRGNLIIQSEVRKRYINALKKADNFDYTDLINFVRS
jgi:Fic-DOC domain mobile mystery protein B